jgi:hypothetical protein
MYHTDRICASNINLIDALFGIISPNDAKVENHPKSTNDGSFFPKVSSFIYMYDIILMILIIIKTLKCK